MKKVNTVLRIAEAPTLGGALVSLYAASALGADGLLQKVFAELSSLTTQATTALHSVKVSSSLEALDAERDDGVRALGTVLAGYAALPVAAKQAAAKELLAVYERYGKGIVTANYASESALIDSLLEDFAAEGLQAHIAALDGVAEAIAALRQAEAAFKAANTEYTKAATAAKEQASASALKKQLLSCINDKLLPYVSATALIDAERYGAFAREVEAEVTRANAATAKHLKKGAAETDGGES